MNPDSTHNRESDDFSDRLESFGIYRLARQAFDEFWDDSEILGNDYRGRELAKQPVRSLDSVCANLEEGYGRDFGKELPQHLKTARREARESRGRYERCARLLPAETMAKRTETLSRIVGGPTKTIRTIEGRPNRQRRACHSSLVTCHHSHDFARC